jgi:uncharacterized protein (TIGR02452 family)
VYQHPPDLNFKSRNIYEFPAISFISSDTITAAYHTSRNNRNNHRVAILNFADALEPGGLVFYGATTQEEDICRCTNLYPCLTKDICKEQYYDYNAKYCEITDSAIYTDALIYSKDVRILRDSHTYAELTDAIYIDVITCPAPACSVSESVLIQRIRGILRAACYNQVDDIILGAWGCGAFRQNPEVVGACFGEELRKVNYFRRVIFAIKPNRGNSANSLLLLKGFRSVYM